MRTIYLDFDGTLVDSASRMYEVYKSIMSEFGCRYLPKEEYWNLKRERQPYSFILSRTTEKNLGVEYMKKFLTRVESEDFLKFDSLIPGVFKTLSDLRIDNRLVLVTLRRSKENLYKELRNLKIIDFFADIFDDFRERVNSWEVTASMVRKDAKFSAQDSVIVGDTEDTALAGSDLGIPSYLVLSGIRSEGFLRKYSQGSILNDITELPGYLSGISDKHTLR